jgi:hypothetical protein
MENEVIDIESEEVDIKAALTGEETKKVKEIPLPPLFDKIKELRRGEEVKVTTQRLDLTVIKRAKLVNLVFESRAIILKMGQKSRAFKTYTPIIVDGQVYTCVAADVKKKLVMFTYVGPHSELSGETQEGIESAALAKSIVNP